MRIYYLGAVGAIGPVGGLNSWTKLGTVNVGTAAASASLVIYDGQSSSGTVVATIDCSALGRFEFNAILKNGLYAVLSGGSAKISITAGG